MRIALPAHSISIDPSAEWIADEMDPKAVAQFGIYLRSSEHGVYFNVRKQDGGAHPRTTMGLLDLLREQSWASAPFDVWTAASGARSIVGGTFETVGMGGEVVLEVFVTDGHAVANIAGPGERAVIAAVGESVRRLAATLEFG
jgi:hypothetical protein